MDADLDTLATALHVRTDDLLKAYPDRAPARPAVGSTPKITDAEPITLAVMQALLGATSEVRWLRFAGAHLRRLFPCRNHSGEAPHCGAVVLRSDVGGDAGERLVLVGHGWLLRAVDADERSSSSKGGTVRPKRAATRAAQVGCSPSARAASAMSLAVRVETSARSRASTLRPSSRVSRSAWRLSACSNRVRTKRALPDS